MSQEQLLEQSADRYQAMLDHLSQMASILKSAQPQAVISALEEWKRLQEEARQLDAQIDLQDEVSVQGAAFQRRAELMAEVAEQCHKVHSQANLLKTMVGEELSRLHQGRKAMGGYKGATSRTGSRISASS